MDWCQLSLYIFMTNSDCDSEYKHLKQNFPYAPIFLYTDVAIDSSVIVANIEV